MLNLEPLFRDVANAMTHAGSRLQVAPLASAVYMMQLDVINHYRYALDHYLHVKLSAPFLQNSSLGTPYEKWAKFTNQDFEELSFAIGNLLRYSSRLLGETEAAERLLEHRYDESKEAESRYIRLVVAIRMGDKGGVRVESDQRLSITPFAEADDHARTQLQSRVLRIDSEELREEVLGQIRQEGEAELIRLMEINEEYAHACRRYYETREVISTFSALHPSYCQ